MQRNKSKKLYSSFHKTEARLADPSKSQIIIKNKNENNSNFETVRRKDSSMLNADNKSISKSSRNLKIEREKKGWKQTGYGSARGNGPLSNRVLRDLVNFSQKKRAEVK